MPITDTQILDEIMGAQLHTSDRTVRAQECRFNTHAAGSADQYLLREEGQSIDQAWPLRTWALSQLLCKLSIPVAFFKRCPGSLQEEIANHFLSTESPRKAFVLRRRHACTSLDSSPPATVRAVLSNRFVPLDDHILLPQVIGALASQGKPISYECFNKTEELTLMQVKFEDLMSGDSVAGSSVHRVYAGMSIRNSEVGYSALYIEPCVMVGGFAIMNPEAPDVTALVRATHTDSGLHGIRAPGRIPEIIQQVRQLAQIGVLQAVEAQIQTVGNPLREVEELAEKSGYLSNRFVSLVMEQIEDELNVTRFRLAQAILECCRNLPLITQYETHARVGKWMGLFENHDRFTAIAGDIP